MRRTFSPILPDGRFGLGTRRTASTPAPSAATCPLCEPVGQAGELVKMMAAPDDSSGAMMIFPTAHRTKLDALTTDEIIQVHRAIAALLATWRREDYDTDANVIWNLGPNAGQSLRHVHVHVVPRRTTDLLPGFGARWWFKDGLKGVWLLRLCALLNPQPMGARCLGWPRRFGPGRRSR